MLLLPPNCSCDEARVGVEGVLLILPVFVFAGGLDGHFTFAAILVGDGVNGGSSPSSSGLIGGVLITPSMQSSALSFRSSSSASSVLLNE